MRPDVERATEARRDLEQRRLLELVEQVEAAQPFDHGLELVRVAGEEAGVDPASVGRLELRRAGRRGGGVASGLALHGGVGDEPLVAPRLGCDVGGGVHADVDELPLAAARRDGAAR